MSNQKIVIGQTQKTVNLTLRSKVNVILGSRMYTTHHFMVIHPWAKYGKPMSNWKKNVMSWTQKLTWKNLLSLTLRSKVNMYQDYECARHIVSWWYTHVSNMVSNGQSKKKLWARHKFSNVLFLWNSYTDSFFNCL